MKTLSKTKYLVLIVFFAWQFVASGQTFKKRELKRLQALSLSLPSNDSLSFDYTQSLRKTLKFDKKYRTNKTFAIILTSIGVVSLIGGISMQLPPKITNVDEGNIIDSNIQRGIVRVVRVFYISVGVASFTAGIPLWLIADKKKVLRDTQVNISRKRFKEIEERLKKRNKNN